MGRDRFAAEKIRWRPQAKPLRLQIASKLIGYASAKPLLDRALDLVAKRYKILGPVILDSADFGAGSDYALRHSASTPSARNRAGRHRGFATSKTSSQRRRIRRMENHSRRPTERLRKTFTNGHRRVHRPWLDNPHQGGNSSICKDYPRQRG